jgi:hypothetical protein
MYIAEEGKQNVINIKCTYLHVCRKEQLMFIEFYILDMLLVFHMDYSI